MSELIFHHTGIACHKIKDEIPHYELLGYVETGERFKDKPQGVRGLFMEHGGARIELLEPLNENSPLHTLLDKGIKMYHQGFLCDSIRDSSLYFIENGAIMVTPPKPSRTFVGRFAAFLMMPNDMLIELIGNN